MLLAGFGGLLMLMLVAGADALLAGVCERSIE